MDQLGELLRFAFQHPVVFACTLATLVVGVVVAVTMADRPIIAVPALMVAVAPGSYYALRAMERLNRDRKPKSGRA